MDHDLTTGVLDIGAGSCGITLANLLGTCGARPSSSSRTRIPNADAAVGWMFGPPRVETMDGRRVVLGGELGQSFAIIGIHAGPAPSSGVEDQPRRARQGRPA